jgi:hypothetical protein
MFTLQDVSDYLWPRNPFNTLKRGYITGVGRFNSLYCVQEKVGEYSDADLLEFINEEVKIRLRIEHMYKYGISSSMIDDLKIARGYTNGTVPRNLQITLTIKPSHKVIVECDSSLTIDNLTITELLIDKVEKHTLHQFRRWFN